MAFGLRDLASVAITATDQTSPAFDSLKRNIADLRGGIGSLQGMLAGLGVGLSAGGFALMIKGAIDAQAALDDLADQTALTVETLSSLQQTARIGGHSFDTVTSTAQKFAKSVAEAAGGNKELLRSFDALGISQERLRTGKFDDLYTEFATKIANAENKTYAIAYATDLAGKSAANALPFFKDLADGGLELARVSAAQAEAADKLQKQFGKLGNEFDTFKTKLAGDVVPWLQKMIAEMNEGIRIAGGFGAALKLGLMLPTDNPGQKAAAIKAEIEGLQKARARYVASNSDTSGIDQSIQVLEQKRQFLLFQQRQQALALGGGGGDANDRQAAAKARLDLRAPDKPPGAADTSGLALITQLENELAALNGTGNEFDELVRKLTDGTKQYTPEVQALALALKGEAVELKAAKVAREAKVKAMEMDLQVQEEIEQLLVKQSDAQAKANMTAYEAIERIKLEAELMGLSNSERDRRIALLDLEKNKLSLTAEQYARYNEEMNAAYDRKAAAESHQKLVEDIKRQNEQITESLTDALMRGFESGKGFAQNFAATLKNMFSTLVLRPILQPIAQGAAGAVTGVLGGMGIPGYANAGGIGGDLMGGIFNMSGVGASVFGSAGAYSTALGLSSSAAGSQAALLAAQTGEFGLAGLAGTASSAGAGTLGAIGTAMPYIGAALLAYSVLKGGSKGGPASFTGLDVSGTAGMEGMLNSNWVGNSQNSKQAFSWQSFDHGATAGINEMIRGVYADMAKLADTLGLDPSRLSGATASFSFRSTGMGNGRGPSTQEVIDAFGQNLGQLTDQLSLQLMPNLKSFALANESATETLVRLVQVQEQLTAAQEQQNGQLANIVRGLPGTLGITGLEGARNALSVSDYMSPMDRLTSARGLLDSTYQSALGGDLASVSAFPQILQQALAIGRDVGASGPAFQALFLEGNKQLNNLLARQQEIQADILRGVDVSIIQAAQDTIGELKRQTAALVASNERIIEELRRIREAA